ncbi:MAG: hypothetical protein JNG89_20550 [Planctomycetaceae bacterium]|nr:hypothetical protein [Planctomycetaceae bacterium]
MQSAFEFCVTGAALSLYEFAIQEADRHKWLVSERHGRDCGLPAYSEWWRSHWREFCRYRRIEHLRGDRRWREYEDDAYGRYYDAVISGDPLVTAILDRVAVGWENLQFACWVQEWGMPRDRVLEILEVVNINTAARMDPKV